MVVVVWLRTAAAVRCVLDDPGTVVVSSSAQSRTRPALRPPPGLVRPLGVPDACSARRLLLLLLLPCFLLRLAVAALIMIAHHHLGHGCWFVAEYGSFLWPPGLRSGLVSLLI